MNNFTTDLMQVLANHGDVNELVRQHLEQAINQLLERELTVFLDYEKWDIIAKNTDNCRNGFYQRTFQSTFGPLQLRIPRDRMGEFQQHTIPARVHSSDSLEQAIIKLYQKGITTREIADLVEKMYGGHYSAASVSRLSKIVNEDVKAFHERIVKSEYVALFCDGTSLPVRRDCVAKESLHVITGIDIEGNKEVLEFALFPTECAENYKEILLSLRERGLQRVLLIVSDGLLSLGEKATDVFPMAKHQNCWVHLQRNVMRKVRSKDKGEITADLKRVYRAENLEEAQKKLQAFSEKWGKKYPCVSSIFHEKGNLFSFLTFPESIRKSLYTNNLAESLNKSLKRNLKAKEQFPNVEALERYACTHYLKYNMKSESRRANGFKEARFELEEMFEAIR